MAAAWLMAAGLGSGPTPTAEARVAPSPAEQRQLEENPALHAAARAYFPTDDHEIAPKRIFRLTRDQLDATVRSLLPALAVRSIKETMPRDPLQTNYEYAEVLALNQANLAALTRWIGEIATSVRKSPGSVIACKEPSRTPVCLQAEARKLVTAAFRGDVDRERLDKIADFYAASVASAGFDVATAELVEIVLSSPDFLFRKELDVDGESRLSPAQRLQALSYTLADVPPDALGLESSQADRHLGSERATTATIRAIVASKAARGKLLRFFKAWLEIKEPSDFTISEKVFPEFKPELAKAMIAETDRFLRTALEKPVPTLKDITGATQSFVSKDLEPIYGVKASDASGAKPVQLDPAQRLGVFSQPAVLASHSGPTDTRPIKRGVFWVRKVMCMEMGAPPQGLDITLYETAETTTERKRIEATTVKPTCAGCHKLIDPLGFFQERYDALGRWRTTDNGHPVDASIDVDFLDEGPARAAGPVAALKLLTGSVMFKQCFLRQLFRFYMGRQEEPADDPLLRQMLFVLANKDEQNVLEVLEALASSERLERRQ